MNCIDIINKRRELWEIHHNIEKDFEFREAVADRLISESGLNLRQEIQEHPEYLIEIFFVIVSKEQEIVPFFLNAVQQIFLSRLNNDIAEFKRGERQHLKYLILKGRQQGFTSFITAYQLASTICRKNFSGFTVADSSDNTATIFEDKAKHPYSLLPEVIKPTEKYNTRREMIFDKLNSKWRVATAGNKEIGRSKTINFFHGSECAFWKSIQSIMGGLGQALTKDSIQILETTANGFNEYRQLWTDSERGENNYTPLFFEWWLTPEYRLNFPNDKVKQEFLDRISNPINEWTKKLNWLYTEKHLELEQLNWYEAKKKDLNELLDQEYPLDSTSAFLTSGNPVFDNAKVLERLDLVTESYKTKPPIKGRFTYQYKNEQIIDSSIKFVPDNNGNVLIFQDVVPYVPYVIGADTAEGGTDFCVGQVINNMTGQQVAIIRGHFDTDIFAKYLYCMGMYFNRALLSVEINFDRHPVKELERLRYPRQYMRENIDTIGSDVQNKFGYLTNRATRMPMISNLVEIVRESTNLISDITTLKEMLTFIKDETGKPVGAEGEHDDCVLSLSIAYASRNQMSFTPMIEEREKTIYDKLPIALISDSDIEEENDEIW